MSPEKQIDAENGVGLYNTVYQQTDFFAGRFFVLKIFLLKNASAYCIIISL